MRKPELRVRSAHRSLVARVARPAFTSTLVALSLSRLSTLSLINLYRLLRDCDRAVNLIKVERMRRGVGVGRDV